MNLKYVFFGLLLWLQYRSMQCRVESITFFDTERPAVIWYDTNFFKNVTLRSKRFSRQDPRHYVDLYIHSVIAITNDIKMDFYFYQFLTNRYRPSFVEMHFSFCDMFHSDTFFGHAMRIAIAGRVDCPAPPGVYHLQNMTIPFVPKGFPFTKGRIYCNASLSKNGVTKLVGRFSIDMEIKVSKINKN